MATRLFTGRLPAIGFGTAFMDSLASIRLPGYPLFLGMCFFFFGIDQYKIILLLQAAIDLCGCLLIAGFSARMVSRKAGVATLYLAALCPFTANLVASPLTETLTLFCIALGLYALTH
jgi:hypothetical protein